jgi:hypothetical protein
MLALDGHARCQKMAEMHLEHCLLLVPPLLPLSSKQAQGHHDPSR